MSGNNFIGERIKSIRESKQLTIEQLSERSGVELEVIKQIEECKELPSLAPLIKIARALGVRLGTFLDDHDELGPVITRNEEITDGLDFSNNSTNPQKRNMRYHPLSQSKAGRHMESFMINIDSSTNVDFVLSSHEGEEFIYVIEGNVEINYGKNKYKLNPGDSIYYDSIVPHHVHAGCCDTAKILAVVYTPV